MSWKYFNLRAGWTACLPGNSDFTAAPLSKTINVSLLPPAHKSGCVQKILQYIVKIKNPVRWFYNQRTRCISRVTTSIRQLFTKLTLAGIGRGVQINTLRYNGRNRSRLHITQNSPVSWIRNSKAAGHIPFPPYGDSLNDSLAFYWFIVTAIVFIISLAKQKSRR